MSILSAIERDPEGFIKNKDEWSKEIAIAIALEQDIELTDVHWQVITLAQAIYHQYHTSPALRAILTAMKKQGIELSSIELAILFPGETAKLINKIAGLPKPVRCI